MAADLLKLKPFERTRLVDEVTDRLRSLILDGTLPPGQQLLQITLSEQLGVSRTPLREALRVLENEGFVRIVNGNNTLEVIDLSPEDMIELYELREVIDGLAARLAAKRGIDKGTSKELRAALDDMRAATEPFDATRRAAAHARFHALLAEASGNRHVIAQSPMIRLTAQMLARRLSQYRKDEPTYSAETLEEGEDDHLAVIEAIEAGDARGAEASARRHIRKTIKSLTTSFPGESVPAR
jgi:GntR family transcriptional regulator of vanillate catabolism